MTSGMVDAKKKFEKLLDQDKDSRSVRSTSSSLYPYFTQGEFFLEMVKEILTASLGKFLSLKDTLSRAFLSTSGNYFNCFRSGHRADKCQSKFSCRTCNRRRHSLLHLKSPASSDGPITSTAFGNLTSNVSACTSSVSGKALMETTSVTLESADMTMIVRALIDPNSIIEARNELTNILDSAGMQLDKWLLMTLASFQGQIQQQKKNSNSKKLYLPWALNGSPTKIASNSKYQSRIPQAL